MLQLQEDVKDECMGTAKWTGEGHAGMMGGIRWAGADVDAE